MACKQSLRTPVVDELRLCYQADFDILDMLASIPEGMGASIDSYYLHRIASDRFEFRFNVLTDMNGQSSLISVLKFGHYGEKERTHFLYYRAENHVLYNPELLSFTLRLPELLGCVFNNFTAIDIAFDFPKNISQLVKRMIRDNEITTIINGKVVSDRNAVLKNLTFTYSTTMNKLVSPTITVKQAEARKNKCEGITVQTYDKFAEIQDASGKQYILEYYGKPKKLHRLEVRLNRREIQDYCSNKGIMVSDALVFDKVFLRNMFLYHLASVLRFRRGRNPISWEEILALGTLI